MCEIVIWHTYEMHSVFYGKSVVTSAWATTGLPVPIVVEGSGPLSFADASGSIVTGVCCAICGTVSSTVGVGLMLLSVAPPTVSQSSPSL
jgi:hypothetical protein